MLAHAGLVSRGCDARWRPAQLAPAPLRAVADDVERYRRHWEERLDRLDDYLQELQEGQTDGRRDR